MPDRSLALHRYRVNLQPGSEQDLWTAFLGRGATPELPDTLEPRLEGKTVLVTGAGGFIGSALARRLAAFHLKDLLLLDVGELGLYELASDLRSAQATVPLQLIVGSISDRTLLAEIFSRQPPQIVFHAAACKHVPLMEANPFTAALTNALGTRSLVEIASHASTAHFILLSTDKAVDPTSIMGATKRVAELALLGAKGAMQTSALRLGNVLGSSGSVAPLFLRQIAQGGPVTVSHPEATRYFLSVDRAVHALLSTLVLDASASVLVPEMGNAYRIQELAEFLVEQAGSRSPAIKIRYTGLRPGDKLEEQLLSDRENVSPAGPHGLRHVSTPTPTRTCLSQSFAAMASSVERRNLRGLIEAICRIVPEYRPSDLLTHQVEEEDQVPSA